MLSKSAARAFFLWGTALCTVVFLGLTIDTFNRIPKQTNSEALTESAIRGKHLWDRNNCMGCHTLLGEGAYYAPELTRVYERRGPAFIEAMLRDPEKMYPGKRRMVKYDFSTQDIADLVAFFEWVGKMDLNGFPAKPVHGATAVVAGGPVASVVNRPQVYNQMCIACHSLEGQGGTVGPALDGVGARRDANYIRQWLTDPAAVKPNSLMPKLPLTDGQIDELTAFLSQLQK